MVVNRRSRIALLVASLAAFAVANPVVERSTFATHPITKKANTLTAKELLAKEYERIKSFSTAATAATGTAVVTNEDVTYIAATSKL